MKSIPSLTIILGLCLSTYAADRTWTNAVDAVWTNIANWDAGVPVAGDTAFFDNDGNGFTTLDLSSSTTAQVKQVIFKSSGAAAYTLGSGGAGAQTLNINEDAGGIRIEGSSPVDQTVDANLTLGSGAATGTIFFDQYNANRTLTLNGNVTKATTGDITFKKRGLGTLRLNGDVSGLNFFQIDRGILQVEADNLDDAVIGNTLVGGAGDNTGTYEFIGATDQTLDKNIYIGDNTAGTSGGLILLNNGTGTVVSTTFPFNNARGAVNQERLLTLGGWNEGENKINGKIRDNNMAATGIVSIVKLDAGRWLLDGENDYTGTTDIQAGILQFQDPMAMYDQDPAQWIQTNISVQAGATLALRTGGWNAANIGTVISNLTLAGAGGFEDGSYFGLDTGGADFTYFNSNPPLTDNGDGGSVGLRKLGDNKLVMNDDFTYTGDTIVEQGTLEFGTGFGRGEFISDAIIQSGAVLSYNKNDNTTVPGNLSGAGTLEINNQASNDELILAGSNTHATTVINVGELVFANTNDVSMYAGTISGPGLLVQRGDGAGDSNFSGEILTLTGNNTYSGGTLVDEEASILAGSDNALGTGLIDLGGTDSGLLLADGINLTNNLTHGTQGRGFIQVDGASAEFSGNISLTGNSLFDFHLRAIQASDILTVSGIISDTGAAGFYKTGSTLGTVTLTADNTYGGQTRVDAGTLLINGNQSAATGAVTINEFGKLGGSGTIGGATTVIGQLLPGNSTGTLTFSGDLNLNASSTTTLELVGTSDFDAIANDGLDTITFDNGATIAFEASAYSAVDGDTFQVLQNWDSISGTLANLNFTGTNLTGGAYLDISTLLTDGKVTIVGSAETPQSLYDDWASSNGLTGANNALTNNPDGDILDNLAEYALDGDPLDPDNTGISPITFTGIEGGTNWFYYVHAKRSDAAARDLTYAVNQDTDLVTAVWTGNVEEVGTNITGSDFDSVTNRVPTDTETKQFLQLEITTGL